PPLGPALRAADSAVKLTGAPRQVPRRAEHEEARPRHERQIGVPRRVERALVLARELEAPLLAEHDELAQDVLAQLLVVGDRIDPFEKRDGSLAIALAREDAGRRERLPLDVLVVGDD